jgi:multimeric flavodoxin WrbA
MNQLYSAITSADLVSFSFPLYFSSLPGSMKNAVDRCNLLWQRKRLGLYSGDRQQGIFFCTAGSEYHDMFSPSVSVLSHFMNSIGGKLRKDLCLTVPGMDTEAGKKYFETLLLDRVSFLSRIDALQNAFIK